MMKRFTEQTVVATMAEPRSGDAPVAGVGPRDK
jgi:hypothetical protein